jgi:hypothetical protein
MHKCMQEVAKRKAKKVHDEQMSMNCLRGEMSFLEGWKCVLS